MASSSNSEFTDIYYDVFLSFRGLDTRTKFTDHLYEALKREGFKTFRDNDEIPKGEFIKPELRKAIMNSRMSVVVLSKNYANSTVCLFELRLILKRRKTSGHFVLPVFFEVDPQEIKQQAKNLDFGEKEVTVEKVKEWSAALIDVAKMAGMVSQNQSNGYEANFTKEIVCEVKRKLCGKRPRVVDHQELGESMRNPKREKFLTSTMLMPPTEDFVESTEARNWERIWECLMNDEDMRIGAHGMGGVGKTTIMRHIYNQVLKETDKFDDVFWVTICKPFTVLKLQSDIAKELKISLSDEEDEERRARQLFAVLSQRKRYVLIIDDLWEVFPLERVGIPSPTIENGCKLVLTTRSLEVCTRMRCKTVKVELLTEEEALKLFFSKAVEDVTVLAPDVKDIATKIAKECACLPLAIVIVGGSMRGLKGIHEWRNALNELIGSTKDTSDGESEVFERLKFSYSRLGDKVLQDCFLYCSLYPEDKQIPVEELIEYWIAEELIADMNNVEAQFDKGYAILAKLTNTSLLESFINEDGEYFIRMHDLIRDMALKITASSPRFMVKAGERLKSVPYEHWSEDLERISFMHNHINKLPITPPFCPQLTTLFLNGNFFQEIPDSFFTYMRSLEVLDLSENFGIKSLPESIFNLVNLRALILYNCKTLRYVPSLEKLKALKMFTLTQSCVQKLPEGMEELVNLIKLDLSNNSILGMFPSCKLRRLSKLRFLRMDGTKVSVSAEDLLCFRELKVVGVEFHNVQELTRYTTSQHWQGLEKYSLVVAPSQGIQDFHFKINGKEVLISSLCEPLVSGVVDQLVLPGNMDLCILAGFDNLINLTAILSLKDARNLRSCTVSYWNQLESIFSWSSFSEDGQIFLGTLEELRLECLPSYRVLFDGIAPPHNVSFNLKILSFYDCHIMKNIFSVQFLQNFPNLEKLDVFECCNVEDIIVEKEEMSYGDHRPDDIDTINLPKLRTLKLICLPRLKSIYNGMMVCQSIEEVIVDECLMVRRLPLSLHMDSQKATAPPSLKGIHAHEEWWESLEWEDPLTKTILQPFLNTGPL